MLKLQNIQLVKFDPEQHSAFIYKWFYSGEYDEYFWMFPKLPELADIQQTYVDRAFMIWDHQTQCICGMVTLIPRHEASRNFESGFLVDHQFKGKGIAKKALKIALDFNFNTKNLYKSFGYVLDKNKSVQEFLKKFGCKIECVLKKHAFFDGEFHDLLIYSIFKNDFNKSYKKEFKTPRLEDVSNVSDLSARLGPQVKVINNE